MLGINAAILALLLLGLEGAVRIAKPGIGPAGTDRGLLIDSAYVDAEGVSTGLRPNASGVSNGARLTVDARGFLRYAGNAASSQDGPSWLLLGDSVTMGIGVDPDSSLAGRLALALDSVRVLNPSLLGYNVGDYLRIGTALAADSTLGIRRATVVWCLNDTYPEYRIQAPGQDGWRQRLGSAVEALNRHSRAYRWLKAVAADRPLVYYRFDRRFYAPHATPPDTTDLDPDLATAFPQALDRLVRLRDTLAVRGIPLDVVVVPYHAQLRPPAPGTLEGDRLPQRVLADHLSEAGLTVRDLAPHFEAVASDPDGVFLYDDGIHLSALGHAVMAEALAAPDG